MANDYGFISSSTPTEKQYYSKWYGRRFSEEARSLCLFTRVFPGNAPCDSRAYAMYVVGGEVHYMLRENATYLKIRHYDNIPLLRETS